MGVTDDVIEDDKQQQILLVGVQSDGTPTKVLCDSNGKLQISSSGGGGSGDIEGVTTAANSGLDGGATSGTPSLTLDINNLTAAAIASGDQIAFSDEGETGDPTRKESIDDVATLFAGNGLTASSAVLSVGAGTGIDVAADAISVDVSDFLANGADNRIVTAASADSLNGEANLTFDGTILDITGNIQMAEISTPSAVADHGKIYPQSTNNLFFQDGAGAEKVVMLGGKHSIWVPAEAITPRSNAGCGALTTTAAASAGQPDIRGLGFDTSSDEHAQFTVAFPRTWNKGTITAQFYWTAIASGSGTVSWGFQGVAMANDDPFGAAFGTAVVTQDTLTAVKDVHVSPESSAITIAGSPGHDELVTFQVFRDVSADNLGVDAVLLGIKIFYTIAQGNEESGKDV
tara:strand:- start:598 stop:1803 length:1206 start_codon:yes stop_codon:yes gene_type:complete